MAASRRSLQQRSVPRPINTKARLNAFGLGIGSGTRSAIGSATQVEFPPSPPRKSSLRSGTKTPSPDANRVRFAAGEHSTSGGDSSQAPRTPRQGSKPANVPNAPTQKTIAKTTTTKTKQTSPTLRFSPRTARKAKEAAKITKIIREQIDFIDKRIDSPPPVTSKIFNGTGIKLGSGLPPTPPRNSKDRSGTSASSNTINKTGLQTPPTTGGTTTKTRNVTITTSPTTQQRQFYVDGVSDWLSGPRAPRMQVEASEETMEIPTNVIVEHMHHLKQQQLRALSLEEMHLQFYLLQKMLRQFSKKYFTAAAGCAEQSAAFDLADLATKHAPFFRMLSYIADGAAFQGGWADFLTSQHTRPHIAYAALSEWLKYNVFGHSCFGLSAAEDAEMTIIDIQYLHYDGFVRTKERAKLLSRILDNKPAWEQELDVSVAVERVVADLLVVLAPILPPGGTNELKKQLHTLVDVAANLHLCIRLTGADGTIVRLQSNGKNDQFAYTARQNCVNKSTVTATIDAMIARRNAGHAADAVDQLVQGDDGVARIRRRATAKPREEKFSRPADRLVIKMPCFPLVQAVVPYGPTLRDYAVEQDMYEKIIRSEDLPPLKTKGPMYIEDIPAEIVRAACFEEMPESCHKDYGRKLRNGEKRMKPFGSYVRQYILNESDVYCEWEFVEEGPSARQRLTLRQAVEQAQRQKYGYVPAERRMIRRKIARGARYVATAGVAAAVVYGIANRTGIINSAVSAVKNLKLPSTLSVEDIKGAVGSAMKATGSRTKLFRQAAARPFGIVKSHASKWACGQLSKAQSRAGQLYNGARPIANKLRNAAERFAADISAKDGSPASAVANLKDATTSALKEAVLPQETVKPTPISGRLPVILQPITVSVREIPVKLGLDIRKITDPATRVSKSIKTVKATAMATVAAKRWYERIFVRAIGD